MGSAANYGYVILNQGTNPPKIREADEFGTGIFLVG